MSANRLKLNKEKTELLWVGSRHSLSQQGCCLRMLQLGSDTITACDHVRLLGVTLSSDLSPDLHCQRVLFILATSVSAFSAFTGCGVCSHTDALVALRIDYCNAVLAYAPKATTDKLQQVLNAAARVVTGTKKFRARLVAASSHRAALARRTTASHVQAQCHDV